MSLTDPSFMDGVFALITMGAGALSMHLTRRGKRADEKIAAKARDLENEARLVAQQDWKARLERQVDRVSRLPEPNEGEINYAEAPADITNLIHPPKPARWEDTPIWGDVSATGTD
jgi:hypothetical protein